MCNFPSCTAKLFHEGIGTPARRALLGRRHRASGVRRVDAAIELLSVANDAGSRVHQTLELVCCDLRRPGQYGVLLLYYNMRLLLLSLLHSNLPVETTQRLNIFKFYVTF